MGILVHDSLFDLVKIFKLLLKLFWNMVMDFIIKTVYADEM